MEAVLIMTELGSPFARSELLRVASDQKFQGDEIRQAAVWGLGKAGLKAYADLLPFIDDADENVAMHAIIGFGGDTPAAVLGALVENLAQQNARKAAAASEVLRVIGNEAAIRALLKAAEDENAWAIATLGRLPPDLVRKHLAGSKLLPRVAPLLLLNEDTNWLASENRLMDLAFLSRQHISA
jgi:HEAT repeat protein